MRAVETTSDTIKTVRDGRFAGTPYSRVCRHFHAPARSRHTGMTLNRAAGTLREARENTTTGNRTEA